MPRQSPEPLWDDSEEPEGNEPQPLEIPAQFRYLLPEQSRMEPMSVRDVWNRYLTHELVLEPDFQRHYVWDETRASRYVESLLLGLPTPPIFLAEEKDGTWVVIDGHQRLKTLFRYMQPLLQRSIATATRPPAGLDILSPLALKNLEVLSDLVGKRIDALTIEDRVRLWDYKLNIVRLPRTVHPELRYELFARLNLGSMSLNPQELRNCLYRGPYNRLLAELELDPTFLRIWHRNEPDKRMKHRELILGFFALVHRKEKYRSPYRLFLNEEMRENQDLRLVNGAQCKREFEGGHAVGGPHLR